MTITHIVRRLTTVVDTTKANSHRLNRTRRGKLLSELRNVGRVHSPEADMRPVMPSRDLLLKSVAFRNEKERCADNDVRKPRPSRARTVLGQLCDEGARHASLGDMEALSQVIQHAMLEAESERKSGHFFRALTINTILGATRAPSHHCLDDVMNVLTTHKVLDSLSSMDFGAVFDVLIQDKLRRNDTVAAFRGELMSRALDTRVTAGTYARLIDRSVRLDAALSLLHRAVAVSVKPTVSMLNRVLALCFQHGDGDRARRVVAEIDRRGLPPNLKFIGTLLRQADSIDGVDAVFLAAQRNVPIGPDVATALLRSYVRVGTLHGDHKYVGKCFALIDWCFENGFGVRRHAVDDLVAHFAKRGYVEAALRAWREMRRAWLGSPSIPSKRALWVQLVKRGTKRDDILREHLARGLSPGKLREMNRAVLAGVENEERDAEVLEGSCVKDCATVLHRWARTGHMRELYDYLDECVNRSRGRGIDVRLLISVLSDSGDTRFNSLQFLLKHLSTGYSVCGDKAVVLARVHMRLWQWLQSTSSTLPAGEEITDGIAFDEESANEGDYGIDFDRVVGDESLIHSRMTFNELHACLVGIVRVSDDWTENER